MKTFSMPRSIAVAFVTLAITSASRNVLALTDPLEIKQGKIAGMTALAGEGDKPEVRAYKGIPFAQPPVGDLRWRSPLPPGTWKGIRRTDSYGPSCPQAPYDQGTTRSIYARPPEPMSEDCLYLNVWTAAQSGEERRPVMVWIHGGALTRGSGSNPTYDGSALARRGAVIVTINYRLGPLGFLGHAELTAESEHHASGNYGILDQIAALQWVKENIAAFGGDPNRVTIFGESAGSFSVNVLVASPLAKGLFHRAIGESGAQFRPGTFLAKNFEGRPSAETMGKAFIEATGAHSIAEARRLSTDVILQTFGKDPAGQKFKTIPCVDGWVLPDEIRNIFADGKQNAVPILVGSNADEMTTLTPAEMVPKKLDAFEKQAKALYKDHYEEFRKFYPAASDAEASRAFLDASRDQTFAVGMRTWAREMSRVKTPAYLYYFTRIPPLPNRDQLRCFHAAEIGYVFGNLDRLERPSEPVDFELSSKMSSYWLNFAATGDPNGPGLPKWEPYDAAGGACMELGETPSLKHDLNKERLDFMEQIGPR